MTTPSDPPPSDRPRRRAWPVEDIEYGQSAPFEVRAAAALRLLAIIDGFAVVLSFVPANPPVATLLTVGFNGAAAILVGIFVAEILGLARGSRWALAAARPLLLVVLVGGSVLEVIALAGGHLRVPFDVVIAGWALLGRREVTVPGWLDPRGLPLVAPAAAAFALMIAAHPLLDWGGALDPKPSAIRASITVDCGAPGAEPPESLQVGIDWSWASGTPIPSGNDVLILSWDGIDASGRPLYFIGLTPDPGGGIVPGRRVYPSADLAAEVMAESLLHWAWGIALDRQAYGPSHVDIELRRVIDQPVAPGPVRMTATYVHLGVWRSEVATAECRW